MTFRSGGERSIRLSYGRIWEVSSLFSKGIIFAHRSARGFSNPDERVGVSTSAQRVSFVMLGRSSADRHQRIPRTREKTLLPSRRKRPG